MSWTQNELNVW